MSKVLLVINGSNYGDAREVVECMSCKEDVCESRSYSSYGMFFGFPVTHF